MARQVMGTFVDIQARFRPVCAWLLILCVILTVEYAVMWLLLLILPNEASRLLESTVDALVLTILVALPLWWLAVRPLRQALRLRARFLTHCLGSIEAERRHIAYELHDGVGQSLTLLVSGLRSLRDQVDNRALRGRSVELQHLAQTALQDIRSLSLGLRPSLLDDLGLAPALERVVTDIIKNHAIAVTVDVGAVADRRLPEEVETALFRIFQEAMNNVIKHADASQVSVTLRCDHGWIVLTVSDNGCGLAGRHADSQAEPGHLGLIGMRERAALLGGELRVESTPGRGTRVIARIPEGRER